jgi:hypothetical protein
MTKPAIDGYCNISTVVQNLWDKAADRLTPEELKWFAGAWDELLLLNLIDVIEGIGCLVNEESGHETGSGAFQTASSVAILLFYLKDALLQVNALTNVAMKANNRMCKPDFYARLDAAPSDAVE